MFDSTHPGSGPVPPLLALFQQATRVLADLPREVAEFEALDDAVLLALQRELATQRRLLDARTAVVAGQVARRCAPELGSAGLAARGGFRTAEELFRQTTGSTTGEATTAVRIGRLMDETANQGRVDPRTGERSAPTRPWLHQVADAVTAARISAAAADAIRAGLGEPTQNVTVTMLTTAAGTVLHDGAHLDADRIYKLARRVRDELDTHGIRNREQEHRDARSLRVFTRPNGMGRLTWDMDPETYQVVRETYDQLTSPKRGGPRFTPTTGPGSVETERRERILADTRRPDQLASDGFLELLTIGTDTAPTTLIGLRRPAVRVLVTAQTLHQRHGHGHLEGTDQPVSIDTIERHTCTTGTIPITFDPTGQPLDVGREQRLYTHRQRIALAARDGGCRWPTCQRPPSWTEAHHIHHWHRDHGRTDTADGILLCRHHHLLLHNNHWNIQRHHGNYWLTPPKTIDPQQHPIPMPTHSPAMTDLIANAPNTPPPARHLPQPSKRSASATIASISTAAL